MEYSVSGYRPRVREDLRFLIVSALTIAILLFGIVCPAGATPTIKDGIRLSDVSDFQGYPVVVADGSGGSLVAWTDCRADIYGDIYCQRLNGAGVSLWTIGGVSVCDAAGRQSVLGIVPDGAGGALIAWDDERSATSHIFAQRVDSAGNPRWTENGVEVCPEGGGEASGAIIADGTGGAVFSWSETRVGYYTDVYAQKVDSLGAIAWGQGGVPVCTGPDRQDEPGMASDGSGGAIVAWTDKRNGLGDVYAQRIDSSGTPRWTADGVPVCLASYDQYLPELSPDGSGGTVLSWIDCRSGPPTDVYAQRLNNDGSPLWATDGVPVCSASGYQNNSKILSDSAGGCITTWQDGRQDPNGDIYAQRVNATGVPQWTGDGVAVCTAAQSQTYPQMVQDGSGGAVIAWNDDRSGGDVYAQRLDSTGAAKWTADGLAVCTVWNGQNSPMIAYDGAGSVVIAWQDLRNFHEDEVYVQKISTNGVPRWAANGLPVTAASGSQQNPGITSAGPGGAITAWQDRRSGSWDIYAQCTYWFYGIGANVWDGEGACVCDASGDQQSPQAATDGSGGAIITWQDGRSGNLDVFAQRIDASGAAVWTVNGVAVSASSSHQALPQITADGSDGAIITWLDRRSGSWDVYAQRIDSGGTALWTANGVAVSAASSHQVYPQITADGSGGAIITWQDLRSGNWDIYTQKLDPAGNPAWAPNGIPACTSAGNQQSPQVTADGAGGAIMTWQDRRSGNWDAYAQRIDSSGAALWTANGVVVSNASGDQQSPQLTGDGAGGAVITWQDYRSGNWDIYTQKLDPNGNPMWTPNGFAACASAKNQQSPKLTPDGSGGAITTWQDYRTGYWNTYAQAVNE